MQMDQFSSQMNGVNGKSALDTPATCPSDFPLNSKDGISYWIGEHPIDLDEEFRNAELPTEVDVAIIGSGITGATVAYRLANAQPDLRVALFDARGVCTGATGRNGGHLGRPEPYYLRQLKDVFGADDAVRVRHLISRNRDMTLEIIDGLGIADAVDLRLGGTIIVFKSPDERENFEKDLKFGIENGLIQECRVLSPEEVLQVRAQREQLSSQVPDTALHVHWQHAS